VTLEAADEVSASVTARLEGKPVEVIGDRTETNTVYAMPDGSMVLAQAMGPVRVRTGGDGTQATDWAPIDLTLAAGEDGMVRPAAQPAGLVLAGKSEAAADGVVLASVVDPTTGERTSVRWLGGGLPEPELSGRRATYRDVEPGVDLVVEANATGFEDFFVLKDRPDPGTDLTFPLVVESDAGQLTAGGDGNLAVVAEDGTTVVSGGIPAMWDAAADAVRDFPITQARAAEPSGLPAFAPLSPDVMAKHGVSAKVVRAARQAQRPVQAPGKTGIDRSRLGAGRQAPVAVRSEQRGKGVALGLVPDESFLQDPATAYPVVIDPSMDTKGATFDTFVLTGNTVDYSTATHLDLGTYDGGAHVARVFFNLDTSAFAGATVYSAKLLLAEYHSWSCSARQWDVWSTALASTSTTWANQPHWSSVWATPTETTGYSSSCPDGWVSADVTSLAQVWAANNFVTGGVGLRAHSETDNYGWKRFYSGNYGAAFAPTLEVSYDHRPNLAGKPGVSPGTTVAGMAWTSTLRPTLTSLVSDPDPIDRIRAKFEVWSGVPDSGTLVDYGYAEGLTSGSVASYQVAKDKLAVGTVYTARVAVTDGTLWNGQWSPTTSFQVDVTPPGAPVVSSSDYPNDGTWHGDVNQAGSFSLDPAADASLVKYQWALDKAPDPNQIVTATTNGSPSTVSITPTSAGKHVLQVQAVDWAGNTSAVVKYAFQVGRAGIVTPDDGAQVVSRVRLDVTGEPQFSYVKFEWRRGPGAPTAAEVPLGDLATSWGMSWQGLAVNGWAPLPTGGTQYTAWHVASTLGGIGGPVQVRARVATDTAGSGEAVTGWVSLVVDPDATGAATTGIGPGSVNLLTGAHTLGGTDAEEFGVSIVRTSSSRNTDSGVQLQKENLNDEQQAASSLTGFNISSVTTGSISSTVSHSGGTSLQLKPAAGGTSSVTYACVGGCSGAMRLGMQQGHTYRVTGWIYVPADTGLSPDYAYGESMVVYAHRPDVTAYRVVSARPAVTDSWQQLSLDITIPADATDAYLVLYNGFNQATVNKPVYWDDLSVREVSTPFGPQWALGAVDSLTGTAYTKITRPSDGVVGVGVVGGGNIWFTSGDDTHWWPQPGAEDLKLTYDSAAASFRLTELDGTTTDFVKDAVTGDYPVTTSAPPGGGDAARQVFTQTQEGLSRLARIIAPVEDGVDEWPSNALACNPASLTNLARGCEVLELTYAESTTATSAVPGDVRDQISAIVAWSWDPDTSAMANTTVAQYAYDDQGRLVQVWDPRLEVAGSNRQATTYTYDSAGRVTSLTPPGEPDWRFTYGAGGASSTGTGDWIDPSPGRLLGVTRASLVPGSSDTLGPDNTTSVVYDVPLTRADGGPYDLGSDALATWVQADGPTDATAVFGPEYVLPVDSGGNPVHTATASVPGPDGYGPATVHYLDASGLEVNTAAPAGIDTPAAGFIDTAEYDRFGNVVRTLDATNRLLALRAMPDADATLTLWGLQARSGTDLAQLLDSRTTYSIDGLDVVSELGPVQQLAVANTPDTQRLLRARTSYDYDQGKPDGAAYHLVTSTVSDAIDPDTGDLPAEVDAADLSTETRTGYDPVDGAAALGATSGWVHKQPTTVTVAAETALETTSTVVYDDHGRPLRSSKPGSSGADAATTVSVLYTAGADATHPECGNHPEWAGQACLTMAAGAVTGHDPARAADQLPMKKNVSYNKWGTPTVVTESATGPVDGSTVTVTRTTTTTYDAADRVTDVAITGTGTGVGQAVATTHSVYDPDTGDVTEVSSPRQGQQPAKVSKSYDVLGRLVSYTDATDATTTSTYDRFGQVTTTTQVIAGETTTTSYTYDRTVEPRGFVTSFTDSVAGTISATWGPDGQLESEQLPGGVTLSISYDPARVPVARTYTRDSDSKELWHDSVVENHHGQWIVHSATTGIVTYTYDGLGRLTSAAETLDVQSGVCTTRGYTYDAHSNRTSRSSVTATVAGTENCPASTGDPSPTTYTYDSADRLVSTTADAGAGWTYDPWGRTTSMPTGDGASVVNGFYVNDLVASQTIAADTRFTWDLDPIQRRQTNTQQTWVNGAWQESATKVAHYATDSDEPSWISEDATDPTAVTRYVSGVEGDVAVTTSTTGDVELQLIDLHGDVVGTVPVVKVGDQTTLGDVTLTRTDEFGAPEPLTGAGATTGPPARYGWLGAAQRSSEALGGVVLMGVRLYSTTTGRFLSVDPVAGGSANAYDYCNADPVNCTDLGGTFSWKGLVKAVAIVGEVASMIPGPVGAAAAAVSAVAYAVQGDKAKAIEMGVTAAANLVGCGPVVKVATRVGAAVKAGAMASRAAPKLERAAAAVKRVLPRLRKVAGEACSINSFAPGTLVVLADGTLAPIETLQAGDLVLATDPLTGDTTAEPVLTPIVGSGTKQAHRS